MKLPSQHFQQDDSRCYHFERHKVRVKESSEKHLEQRSQKMDKKQERFRSFVR